MTKNLIAHTDIKHSLMTSLKLNFQQKKVNLIAGLKTVHCKHQKTWMVFVWFDLVRKVPLNSYGHVGTVISPNHTFFIGKHNLAVNQYFVHILWLVTDHNPP